MKEKEYLIQGLNKGQVEECLTARGIESAVQMARGNWPTWFDEIRCFDISDPLNPIRITL